MRGDPFGYIKEVFPGRRKNKFKDTEWEHICGIANTTHRMEHSDQGNLGGDEVTEVVWESLPDHSRRGSLGKALDFAKCNVMAWVHVKG